MLASTNIGTLGCMDSFPELVADGVFAHRSAATLSIVLSSDPAATSFIHVPGVSAPRSRARLAIFRWVRRNVIRG